MGDVVFVVTIVAFFTLMVGFVRMCDRIIAVSDGAAEPGPDPAVDRAGLGMSADNVVGLVLAILLVGYLGFALVAPEKL